MNQRAKIKASVSSNGVFESMSPRQILIQLETDSFSVALRRIFELRKLEMPRFSLAYICKQSGINSRGYLSEVMAGKRRLKEQYLDVLFSSLKLSHDEQSLLRRLWQLTATRDKQKRETLKIEIQQAKKSMSIVHKPFESPAEMGMISGDFYQKLFFAFKVFAAFDLCCGSATEEQLKKLFAGESLESILNALKLLQSLEVITKQNEHYEVNHEIVLFQNSNSRVSASNYTKTAILNSAAAVDQWFHQGDLACFYAIMLTVRQDGFQAYLAKLKQQIKSDLAQLMATNGDSLIHFNLQIYPMLQGVGCHAQNGDTHGQHFAN